VFPESELSESAAPEREIPVVPLGLPAVPEAVAPEIAGPAAIPVHEPAEAERTPRLPAGLAEICEETGVNEMFTDLIREVNALTDHEIAREDFETHFSLV